MVTPMFLSEHPKGIPFLFMYKKEKRESDKDAQEQVGLLNSLL